MRILVAAISASFLALVLSPPSLAIASYRNTLVTFDGSTIDQSAIRRGGGARRAGGINRSRNFSRNRSFNRTRNVHVNRNVNINRNVRVNRNVRINRAVVRPGWHGGGTRWVRPAGYWWRPGAAIAAGAAIGYVTAATAVTWAATPAPGPDYCWYYTDASRTKGFWDACP